MNTCLLTYKLLHYSWYRSSAWDRAVSWSCIWLHCGFFQYEVIPVVSYSMFLISIYLGWLTETLIGKWIYLSHHNVSSCLLCFSQEWNFVLLTSERYSPSPSLQSSRRLHPNCKSGGYVFYSASVISRYDRLCPSVCLSACPSQSGSRSKCFNLRSCGLHYSTMTLVSPWLTSPANSKQSKGNIESEGAKWERGRKIGNF